MTVTPSGLNRCLFRTASAWAAAWAVALAPAAGAQAVATRTDEELTEAQRTELATFVSWLRDDAKSPEDRRQAATLLLNKGWPEAEDVLVEALSNKDRPNARLAVAEALAASVLRAGSNGVQLSDRFIGPLLAALGDSNAALRRGAARALAFFKDRPEVVNRLRAAMLDPAASVELRRGAILAVSQLPPSVESIDPLVTRLLVDRDAGLRAAATEALNQLTLMNFADDPVAWQKWWTENRGKSPWEWQYRANQLLLAETEQLRARQGQLEKRLAAVLETLYQSTPQPQQSERLLGYLNDPLAAVRAKGVELVDRLAAGKVPEAVRKVILERLSDDSPAVRAAVADVLAYLGEPKPVAELLNQLAHETDPTARRKLVKALGQPQLRAPEAIPILIQQLAQTREAAVAAEAAIALGAIGARDQLAKEAVEPIITALLERFGGLNASDGPTAALREAIIVAMADIADARFSAILVGGLTAGPPAIRLASARGLRGIGRRPGQGPTLDVLLARLSGEPDRGVRLAILDALAGLGLPPGQLDAVFALTNPAVEADEAIRKKAWDTLCELLKSADKPTQLNWTRRLEASTDPAAAGRLADLLSALEARGRAEKWSAAELTAVSEPLADALVKIQRSAEAVPRYELIYQQHAQDKSDRLDAVALKYLQALLSANQPDKAILLLKERLAGEEAKGGPPLVEALIAHLDVLADSPDPAGPAAALTLLDKVRGQLPEAALARWASQLAALADRAACNRSALLAEQVRKSLDQIAGGDAAAQAAARKRIEQLGTTALGLLLDELEKAAAGGDDMKERERLIAGLLGGPPVSANDYDPAAPLDKKKALLAAYRERLKKN